MFFFHMIKFVQDKTIGINRLKKRITKIDFLFKYLQFIDQHFDEDQLIITLNNAYTLNNFDNIIHCSSLRYLL